MGFRGFQSLGARIDQQERERERTAAVSCLLSAFRARNVLGLGGAGAGGV